MGCQPAECVGSRPMLEKKKRTDDSMVGMLVPLKRWYIGSIWGPPGSARTISGI